MARQRSPLPIPQLECPLGDEHCHLLDAALKSCGDLRAYLEKIAALGLDVTEWLAQVEANQRLASGIKAAHFPDRN